MHILYYTYTGEYTFQEGESFCVMQKFDTDQNVIEYQGIKTIGVIDVDNVTLIGNRNQYRIWLNEFYIDTNLQIEEI